MLALVLSQVPVFPEGILVPAWCLALVLVFYYAVSIWDRLRQKPPVHDLYARKEDVEREDTRLRVEIVAANERSERRGKENRDLVQEKCNELERIIISKISDNKENTSAQFGELRGELLGVRSTMQNMSNEMMRAIGRIEGATKKGVH